MRSTWARNSWPSPAPALAPSIRPGMSAITSWRSPTSQRPEHGLERGERVVGDLRRGAREPREQRGLAGVRQADEADVGEQAQLELEPAFLAGEAPLGEGRGLPGRRGVVLVAAPAGAAAREHRALARPRTRSCTRPVRRRAPSCPAGRGRTASRRWRRGAASRRRRRRAPARNSVRRRNAWRSRSESSHSSTTSPPSPPSPPSGPPRGTCASRRKLAEPSPPRPASTWMRARSYSMVRLSARQRRAGGPRARRAPPRYCGGSIETTRPRRPTEKRTLPAARA